MYRILVTPDQLRSVSLQLRNKVADLISIEHSSRRALGNLDWKVLQKSKVEALVLTSSKQAKALASQMEWLRKFLDQSSTAFLEADNRGFGGSVHLPPSGGAPWWMNRIFHVEVFLPLIDLFPKFIKNFWNSVLKPIYPILPSSFITFSTAILVNSPSWLQHSGPEIIQNSRPELAENVQGTRLQFGDLLEKDLEVKPFVQGPSGEPPLTDTAQWRINVPLQSQQGLKYNDKNTQWGCVPTSTSMILEYWHNQDPNNKTIPAQELLNLNVSDGEFTDGSGMGIDDVVDELAGLNYETSIVRNSSLTDLFDAVSRGPVLTVVKLGMKTKGTNHAVVVTGFSIENNTVSVNDPWSGTSDTYTWDQFNNSWGADYGRDRNGIAYPSRNFVTVQPKG